MVIKGRPNDHLPLFYMMARVERRIEGGITEFGIPTDLVAARGLRLANQRRLVDEPQFCVFIVDEPPP